MLEWGMSDKADKQKVGLYLDRELWKRVRFKAVEMNSSASGVVEDAIHAWLRECETPLVIQREDAKLLAELHARAFNGAVVDWSPEPHELASGRGQGIGVVGSTLARELTTEPDAYSQAPTRKGKT